MTDCLSEFLILRTKYGTSEFDRALKTLAKQRIAAGRPKRIHLSLAKRDKLLKRYGGRCHICRELIDPRSRWHVDHKNPHLTGDDFNDQRNLAPAHEKCNLEKSSKSVDQLSRERGLTYAEIIGEEP